VPTPPPTPAADPEGAAAAAAVELSRRTGVARHDVAVVLGSGWGPAADALGRAEVEIPVAELPGFTPLGAPDHKGTARSVELAGGRVLVLLGRTHLYEGHGEMQAVHPVRTACAAGAGTVVLTNAAGGIDPSYAVGQPVLIADHVNLTARSPLVGPAFVDLTDAYDPHLRALARELDPALVEGVYAGVVGPHFETPAEIRMLRTLGADLVGMSTVLETIAARAVGARVVGIALVSNPAAGTTADAIDHRAVLDAVHAAAAETGELLRRLVTAILHEDHARHGARRRGVGRGMTSRAVQYRRYGGPEVLEIVDREDPTPGAGEVRVAVRAASVNPVDWKIRRGAMASADAPDAPTVTGMDMAGVVEEVGSGVTDLQVGQEVLGQARGGAFAERIVTRADALMVKPPSVSWEAAASLPVIATTAYRTLHLLGLGEGDHQGGTRSGAEPDHRGKTLLVGGASGGVGTMVVQLALARGVTVIGSASEAHQDDVRALGAIPVVYGPGLADRVRAVAPGGTVDAALDTAGKGSLPDLIELTGSADRVLTIADPSAGEHGVRFTGGGDAENVAGALAEAVALVADGRLSLPTITTYPLDDAARAQADNETGRVAGKLVVTM